MSENKFDINSVDETISTLTCKEAKKGETMVENLNSDIVLGKNELDDKEIE